MKNELVLASNQVNQLFIPARMSSNEEKRIRPFALWLEDTGQTWLSPDVTGLLMDYRDDLVERGLSAVSINAYLSTVRRRFADMINDGKIRATIQQFSIRALESAGQEVSPANIQAMVNEVVGSIERGLASRGVTVKALKRPDQQHLRLTPAQVRHLLAGPNLRSLWGIRDRAIFATLLYTGIRVAELSDLRIEDLNKTYMGYPALLVRSGKGSVERYVPYGVFEEPLFEDVNRWRHAAQLSDPSQPLFYGILPDRTLFETPITTRGVGKMLAKYPIMVGGEERIVEPHDLRRTYARSLYDAGMATEGIQRNLGHRDIKTTWVYIGDIAPEKRIAVTNPYL